MSRLIDAEVLAEGLMKRWDVADKNAERIISEVMANVVTPILTGTPTVDAVEVVHGEWLQMEFWPNGGTWRCSECSKQIMFQDGTPITQEIHYCPKCGAKMDGGDKE